MNNLTKDISSTSKPFVITSIANETNISKHECQSINGGCPSIHIF